MQTDPIFYEDQMNMYAYVHNDPMNAVDPTGEMTKHLPGSESCNLEGSCRVLSGGMGARGAGTAGTGRGVNLPKNVNDGAASRRATVGTSGTEKAPHKNSRTYDGETHVYAVRKPDGTVNKVGESAQGARVRDGASKRAEQQVRKLNREVGPGHTSEIRRNFPNKDAARTYETNVIERYRRMYGQDTLPGNKTNR